MKTEDDHIRVQIYQAYIETISANELRRQQTTTTFLTLIAGALAALGFLSTVDSAYPVVVTLVLAILWRQKIQFFQDLASAKWTICHKLETNLPESPFTDEFAILESTRRARWMSSRKLSDIEKTLPVLLILASIAYLLFRLGSLIIDPGTA